MNDDYGYENQNINEDWLDYARSLTPMREHPSWLTALLQSIGLMPTPQSTMGTMRYNQYGEPKYNVGIGIRG